MRSLLLGVLVASLLLVGRADDDVPEGEVALTAEQEEQIASEATKFQFQAEVNRLMEIIIHSLYTNRNIFFRELLSNAGDALDKTRYQSLLDPSILGETKDLDIKLRINKDAKTISFRDTGCGMTKAELEGNLGTVARSGTAHFLEAMGKNKEGDENTSLDLIGQFGVGFYSAFLVADEVTVVSKSNDDEQYIWRSKADGNFIVVKDPRGNTLGRGTEVILKLKEDSEEFLENSEVENVVKKYSMFLQYPIKLWKSKTVTEEVPVEPEEDDEDDTEGDDDDDLTAEDDEDDEPETKTVEKTVWDFERLNQNKPVWTKRPSEVSDEEYTEFYKAFEKASDAPLAHTHFKAEGEIEFSSVLFIPKKAPFGLYDNYYTTDSELKLFVRRVLVADKWKEFIPRYLNFIRGLVDSNDLPLNVNREQLQKNKIMKVISKKVTRKALDMLRKLAESEEDDDDDDEDDEEGEGDDDEPKADTGDKPKKYSEFWEQFGKSIKLGIIEDSKNRKKLLNLLRFKSTTSDGNYVSLQSYVDRMKEGQKNIFYITAATQEEAEKASALERIKTQGYEVLYFTENLDEYMNLSEYDDYQFQSVTKDGLELGATKAEKQFWEDKTEDFEDFTAWYKELLGSSVNKVQVSSRLTGTPITIVTSKFGVSANMERLSKGQAFGSGGQKATKIVEVNPLHPLIKELANKSKENGDDENVRDLAFLLYDSALVSSGFAIDGDNGAVFAQRVRRLLRAGLGVAADATVEELPEFAEDEDEDEDDEDDEDDEEEEEEEEEEEDEEDEEEGEADGDDEEVEKEEL